MSATEQRPLKVLTEDHRSQVANFNQACRDLQRMGVRLHRIDLVQNSLTIGHEDGRALVLQRRLVGLTRRATAGSTFYTAQFQDVTLDWREPISHTRPDEYTGSTFH